MVSTFPGRVAVVRLVALRPPFLEWPFSWDYNKKLTGIYLNVMESAAKDGLSFQGKNVLMTFRCRNGMVSTFPGRVAVVRLVALRPPFLEWPFSTVGTTTRS
jgi:hypothetical protein